MSARAAPWWRLRRSELLDIGRKLECAYVYARESIAQAARELRSLRSCDRIFYAMKANAHPEVLRTLVAAGLDLECVSRGEIARALEACPGLPPRRLLYTPNFAPRDEYAWAFAQDVTVTIDNPYVLRHWAPVFEGREVMVRVDTGTGRGHHEHVQTAGEHAKFGIPPGELGELAELAAAARCRIIGLHSHSGSGVFEIENWPETAVRLLEAAKPFPVLKAVNIGGGLGVPEQPGQAPLDLAQLDAALEAVHARAPGVEFWLEPGRYLVAAAGVLLARVTQVKDKGATRYIGVATGMNSLIRPALYGSWHEIVNLSRLDQEAGERVTIVGPICESGDVLGRDRLLPPTLEGDVLLVANVGAYGRVMASGYNLREPAPEIVI
jgi:bifunctional diaminopimelate decarboxylase / aspartate kinase